jgi:hypothetical protein
MSEDPSVLSLLRDFNRRSHQDQMAVVDVAGRWSALARQRHVDKRMEAQVDLQLKNMDPCYEPPEAEPMFINNGFITDEQTMQSIVESLSGDKSKTSAKPADSDAQQAELQKQQQAANAVKPKTFLQKYGLPLMAAAIPAAGIMGGLIANYLDSDSIEQFDVEGTMWSPESVSEPQQ